MMPKDDSRIWTLLFFFSLDITYFVHQKLELSELHFCFCVKKNKMRVGSVAFSWFLPNWSDCVFGLKLQELR